MEKVGSFVSPSDGDSSSSSIPASSVSVSSPQAAASDSESLVDPTGAVCFARNGGAASLHTVSGRTSRSATRTARRAGSKTLSLSARNSNLNCAI
jgi:hypothetical protein